MAFDTTARALDLIGLPWSLKGPLVALAHCENSKTRRCTPSVRRVAEIAGVAYRTALLAIGVLEAAKGIRVLSGRARARCSRYELYVEKWDSSFVKCAMAAYQSATVAWKSATDARKALQQLHTEHRSTIKKNPVLNLGQVAQRLVNSGNVENLQNSSSSQEQKARPPARSKRPEEEPVKHKELKKEKPSF